MQFMYYDYSVSVILWMKHLKQNSSLNTFSDDLFRTLDFAAITVFVMSEVDESLLKFIYITWPSLLWTAMTILVATFSRHVVAGCRTELAEGNFQATVHCTVFLQQACFLLM